MVSEFFTDDSFARSSSAGRCHYARSLRLWLGVAWKPPVARTGNAAQVRNVLTRMS